MTLQQDFWGLEHDLFRDFHDWSCPPQTPRAPPRQDLLPALEHALTRFPSRGAHMKALLRLCQEEGASCQTTSCYHSCSVRGKVIEPNALISPRLSVLAVGWSWSPYLCQQFGTCGRPIWPSSDAFITPQTSHDPPFSCAPHRALLASGFWHRRVSF